MTRLTVLLLVLLGFGVGVHTDVYSQEPDQERQTCYDRLDAARVEQLITIFHGINRLRITSDIAPYALNDELCLIANEQAHDIASRADQSLDWTRRSDGTALEDWLRHVRFSLYPDAIPSSNLYPRIAPFQSQYYPPDKIVEYLYGNHRDKVDFIFQNRYREIGIGYTYNATRNIHYYIFIYASRPNVLPVTVTSLERQDMPIERTENRRMNIWLSDEVLFPTGYLTETIGRIHAIRISEEYNPNFSCPVSRLDAGWSQFRSRVEYPIRGMFGRNTIYVYFCDETSRRHIESVDIILDSENYPIAEFKVDTIQGQAPLTIQFNNESRFAERYEWDFNGDNIPDAFTFAPEYTFTEPGVYVITLTAFSPVGETDQKRIQITVLGNPVIQADEIVPTPVAPVAENVPLEIPTAFPTPTPTFIPTSIPTELPTVPPTITPTSIPTEELIATIVNQPTEVVQQPSAPAPVPTLYVPPPFELTLRRVEDRAIILKNSGAGDITQADLSRLKFDDGAFLQNSEIARIRPRHCGIFTRLYSTTEEVAVIDFTPYFLDLGCEVGDAFYQGLGDPFWIDDSGYNGEFTLEYDGVKVVHCSWNAEICETDWSAQYNQEVDPSSLNVDDPSQPFADANMRLSWQDRVMILQNISQDEISAGQILNLNLLVGEQRFPDQITSWNSYYDFQTMRPNECIVLVGMSQVSENPNDYVDYSFLANQLSCSHIITALSTRSAVWMLPEAMTIYLGNRHLQVCEYDTQGECYFNIGS